MTREKVNPVFAEQVKKAFDEAYDPDIGVLDPETGNRYTMVLDWKPFYDLAEDENLRKNK